MPKLEMPSFFGDSFRERQSTVGHNSRPENYSMDSNSTVDSPHPSSGKLPAQPGATTVELHGGGANARTLKQGFLSKTSRHMRVWRARFFVLEADLLVYYTSDREANAVPRQKPKGHIPLHGSVTHRVADPLGFKLKTPQRVYAFRAESSEQVEVLVPPPSALPALPLPRTHTSTPRKHNLRSPTTSSHCVFRSGCGLSLLSRRSRAARRLGSRTTTRCSAAAPRARAPSPSRTSTTSSRQRTRADTRRHGRT